MVSVIHRMSDIRSLEMDSIEVVCPEPVDTYATSSVQSSINDRPLSGNDATTLKPHNKSSPRQHSGPLQHSPSYLTTNEMPLPKSRSYSDVTSVVLQQSSPTTTGRAKVKQVAVDGPSDTPPDLPRPVRARFPNEQGRLQHDQTMFPTKIYVQPSSHNDEKTNYLHLPDPYFRPISPPAKPQSSPPNSLTGTSGHSAYLLNHQFNLTSASAQPQFRYSTPQPYIGPQPLYRTTALYHAASLSTSIASSCNSVPPCASSSPRLLSPTTYVE